MIAERQPATPAPITTCNSMRRIAVPSSSRGWARSRVEVDIARTLRRKKGIGARTRKEKHPRGGGEYGDVGWFVVGPGGLMLPPAEAARPRRWRPAGAG